MNAIMTFKAWILGLVAAVVLGVALAPVQPLEAQSAVPYVDTWSGHNEAVATFSGSINTTTAVIAAVSGKKINVRAITMRSSSAGVVVFQDGSGGTTIGNFYLEADVPYTIYENALGPGMKTSTGNGLYAVLSGATLTTTIRYRAN